MSLPSSGQITLNDFRTEFSQSAVGNYYFDIGASIGYETFDGASYAPVNVHSGNSGKYATNYANNHFSYWYGYNHSLYYDTGSTARALFFNINPTQICYGSCMIPFYLGTSNGTYNIRISGSANDFSTEFIDSVWIWYGKPWASNGSDYYTYSPTAPWGAQPIYSASYGPGGWITPSYNWFTNGLDINFDYNYVYNASSGSYIYAAIYAYCP